MLFSSPGLTLYILAISFLLGAALASFLGCMAFRMGRGESVLKGRSHCDKCGRVLGAADLVPVLSYLIRRGKCRYCGEKISPALLWGEVILALLFVLCTLRFDITPALLLNLFFVCILYLISLTDIDTRTIPDGALIAAVIARLVFFCRQDFSLMGFLALVLDGLSLSLPVLLIALLLEKALKKEAMGGGDIKLLFVLGLYLGWQNGLIMLLFACLAAILFAALRAKTERGAEIPFGPFLSAGSVFALLTGDLIWQLYLSLFL